MGVRRAIVFNALAGVWSRLSGTLVRLAQVPLLISLLGADDYGRWLLLSSIPAWLSLANFGFGSTSANSISMAVVRGDLHEANRQFSTTVICVGIVGILMLPPILIGIWGIPWQVMLGISGNRLDDVVWAASLLACSIFIAFFDEVFGSRLRAANATHVAMLIGSWRPWVEFGFIGLLARHIGGFKGVALATLCSSVVMVLAYWMIGRSRMRTVRFSASRADRQLLPSMLRHGVAFQAFPLGNVLIYQGTLFIIQNILGPVAVATFATARTVVRTLSQIVEVVNHSVWPEFSRLIASGDYVKATTLHRLGVSTAVWVSLGGGVLLLIFGMPIYELWLGGILRLSHEVLATMVFAVVPGAIWAASGVVLMSTNQHGRLAIIYVGAAIGSLFTTSFFCLQFGLAGAAISTLLCDAVIVPFVLQQSRAITHDTSSMVGFFRSIFKDFPRMLLSRVFQQTAT